MLRLSRTRRNDPVFQNKTAKSLQHVCGADAPQMIIKGGDIILSVSAPDLIDKLPDYDARRQILATDSLASVDGFRIVIQLTFQHLFGINFCPTVLLAIVITVTTHVKTCLEAMPLQKAGYSVVSMLCMPL